MADIEHVATANLIDMNVAAGTAVGFINPLGAQLDAMIAANLNYRADLSSQLDASLALQATLALNMYDVVSAIKYALEALIELRASLPSQLLPSVELGAAAALSAALSAKLAALISIDAAIPLKNSSIRAAADILAHLNVGPAVLLTFNGLSDSTTLGQFGAKIKTAFESGVGVPPINPNEPVAGIIIVTAGASVAAALGAIITGSPL
jgi:hypothetical protein